MNRTYDQICDIVKQSDKEIIFVGVINKSGRRVAGGNKEGIKPFSTEREDEMLFMELVLRVRVRKGFDK
jgi:23S rRNA maturation-related 3'-5' exoribonuclease YhaM